MKPPKVGDLIPANLHEGICPRCTAKLYVLVVRDNDFPDIELAMVADEDNIASVVKSMTELYLKVARNIQS